jgi:hypothetical protein
LDRPNVAVAYLLATPTHSDADSDTFTSNYYFFAKS